MRNALYDLLESCTVQKGCEYTHTSIYDPTASFYVPPDKTEKFYELYKAAVLSNADLYLTEKHRDIGPIVIDLDFRFSYNEGDNIERKYTHEHLLKIVEVYCNILQEYLSDVTDYKIYVMEKPAPVVHKGLLKDGIHIVIPDIVTRPVFQLMLREKVLKDLSHTFTDLPLTNDIKDIVDEAVIERNNWQMYGSKKPHLEQYKVTHIFKYTTQTREVEDENIALDSNNYVELLSIRNKYSETKLKIEKQEDIEKHEALIQERKMRIHFKNSVLSKTRNTKMNYNEDDFNQAGALVDLLSITRANSYNDWIRTGWCLRNIDYRLLDKFKEFSKKSPKFVDGECEKMWDYMRQDGACLGLGTLHLWAKQDNPDMYAEKVQLQLRELIRQSKSGTEYDVARVIEKMYNHQFIYDSKNKLWYAFHNHRWHMTDDGFALKKRLPVQVADEYRKSASFFQMRAAAPDIEPEEKERLDAMCTSLQKVIMNLKKASFQSSVMTEAAMLFNVEKIDDKFDSNTHLIGFENGVYDLDALEFRDGRPEDYITLSTGINYAPYDASSPAYGELYQFLSQILRNENVREYVLRLFASFLHGNIREERFHVWTGVGSNGKSKILELFEKAFGEYCCTLPIALLTQKRGASNSASPELSRAKSKRFACLQEPGENERLNIGLMKEMTGGDKVYSRGLYREGSEWKPQFKMILTCNHLPVVPSDDGGTWRRIRVVRFESRFCEHPDPQKPNEFPINTELSQCFDEWKEPFMSLLVEYYKKVVTIKMKEPEEVLECTREYQRRNDIIMDFLDNAIEKHESGFLSITDAFMEFKSFLKEEGVTDRGMRKADFQSYIEKQYGKSVKKKLLKGWVGYRLRSSISDFNAVDDYD